MSDKVIFDTIPPVDDLGGVIEDVFGVKLDIKGGWGYDDKTAVEVGDLKDIETDQFLHMFGSIRANVEMNLTLEEEDRYGGINLHLEELKEFDINGKNYKVATYTITAMPEKKYAGFIQEYKDNYGKKEFDLDAHFKAREESTIKITADIWYLGLVV